MNDIVSRLSFLAGFNWLKTALTACRREPFALGAIAVFYMTSMGILSMLSFIGTLVVSLFMPFGTVLLGRGVRETLARHTPSFRLLVDIWNDRALRQVLIQIGLFFAVGLSTVNLLFDILAADTIAQWGTLENGRLDWSTVAGNLPWTAIVVTLVIYLPVLAATWFAPLLASEKRMSCGKALFYSFFGCLRSLAAIIVLGVLLTAVVGLGSVLVASLISALGLAGSEMFLIVPFAFAASTVLYSVYWPMYVSLFGNSRG